jgi:hypothetical protein
MRAAAILAFLVANASPVIAQVAGDQKRPPHECSAFMDRVRGQNGWWNASTTWPELRPSPASDELSWSPVHVVAAVHGPSYYLVAHQKAQQCYVVVCEGTANVCRYFHTPVSNESPNR